MVTDNSTAQDLGLNLKVWWIHDGAIIITNLIVKLPSAVTTKAKAKYKG